jgi:N-[(2S)-2-amino-2-carboxyethyl]-L-glutamate dehydrogenase
MRVLGHREVGRALAGRELDTIAVIRDAYQAYDQGRSVVPFSSFMRPAGSDSDRFIALPAMTETAAGLKWIASFPGNLRSGLPRASAVIVLNSPSTGYPVALLEGSLISAQRTAASAVLAALLLCRERVTGVSLIGCGAINSEVLRFLAVACPGLTDVTLYDSDPGQARRCADACAAGVPAVAVRVAPDPAAALAEHRLVSIATTATRPHLDLRTCRPDSTLLHVSLRDIQPQDVLGCQNVVDDADHVCRERTSVFLAAQLHGSRDFIDASIGQLARGGDGWRRAPGRTVIFSPFGLGALDVALAEIVLARAEKDNLGQVIEDFNPGARVADAGLPAMPDLAGGAHDA